MFVLFLQTGARGGILFSKKTIYGDKYDEYLVFPAPPEMSRAVSKAAFAAVSLAASLTAVALYFADVCEPTKFYINSSATGYFLCPACVSIFVSAVLSLTYEPRGVLDIVLPHAAIVLSLTVETLTVTNFFNHAMELLTSSISKSLIVVYATLSLLMSLSLLCRAISEIMRRKEK